MGAPSFYRVVMAVGLLLLGACATGEARSDATADVVATQSEAPSTAACVQGADWPSPNNLLASTTEDIDIDGEPDEISVYVWPGESGDEAWVRVGFANGGVATGQWDGDFEPVPDAGLRVADFTPATEPGETYELIVQIGEATALDGWSVMAIEDCTLVTTTLDGDAFEFAMGSSEGLSTIAGCSSLGRDHVALIINERAFDDGEWTTEEFELRGTEWTQLESTRFADFPEGDGSIYYPIGPSVGSCSPDPTTG